MLLRVPFSKRANATPRLPTNSINSRYCLRSVVRGIRICHGPQILHDISKKDIDDVWSLRLCQRNRWLFRTFNSRWITTNRTCFSEGAVSLGIPRDNIQSVNTVSIPRTEHEPSTKTEVVKPEVRLQDKQVRKKKMRVRYFISERRTFFARGHLQCIRRGMSPSLSMQKDSNPLAAWLDSKSRPERAAICTLKSRKYMHGSRKPSLSATLLFHLEMRETQTLGKRSLLNTLVNSALPSLDSLGFSPKDLRVWGDILTASTDEEVVRRYLSCQSKKPMFLLLEILRRPHLDVKSFCSLLVHAYHRLRTEAIANLKDSGPEHVLANYSLPLPPSQSTSRQDMHPLQYTTFEVLLCRLLFHARRVWPSAVITISNMVVSYCERLFDEHENSPQIYSRLCKIHNLTLNRLALPASVNPMRSMTYNWQAQRILLASAAAFQPSLQLNKTSYRAVARVLLASGKSSTESRHATLLQRTWPPWRKELDGMDVQRSPDEDISRVVAVLSRMKEAGYAHDPVDKALNVLGGREPDGTPTIQTRRLVKIRPSGLNKAQSSGGTKPHDCTIEWAARITATRDVHEAWDAFQGFTRDGQRPSHSMYHAMFEKLVYRTLTDAERQSLAPVAGDAREALPTIDDNTSASETLRMQPPTSDALYSRMIADGIHPSGRFLGMLVANARSLESLTLYMKNGAISYDKFVGLLREPVFIRDSALKSIPDTIFEAFIHFLCRLRDQPITDPSEYLEQEESIVCFKHHSDSIVHAFELVKRRQPSSRYVWHTIIRAAARSGFIFDPSLSQYVNDIMSWRFVEAVTQSSLEAGFQLDTQGFGRVCIGLEKAIRAKPHVVQETAAFVQKGPETIKEIFAKLSGSVEANLTKNTGDGPALPKMLFDFAGHQLHRYIRVLGLTDDIDETTSVLQWMVKHKEELDLVSIQSNNGPASLRRTLVAARAFLGWTGADEKVIRRLRAVMEDLDGSWGGWPSDDEVESYLSYEAQDDSEGQ